MTSVNQKTFRTVALIEAVSFLVLLVATAVKYGADFEGGVKVMGPIHGFLFLAYVFLALMVAMAEKWSLLRTIVILVAAVIPTGGFFADKWVANNTGPFANKRSPQTA